MSPVGGMTRDIGAKHPFLALEPGAGRNASSWTISTFVGFLAIIFVGFIVVAERLERTGNAVGRITEGRGTTASMPRCRRYKFCATITNFCAVKVA
jgi:hypothetical protein